MNLRSVKYALRFLPDKLYIQLYYFAAFKKFCNFKNPKSFNEKLQWLKLHDHNPEYINMVDKATAKEYAASIIGKQYIIPTLGIWDKFEDIDFNLLPNQFVLKCTHDSGGVVICRDKSKFDINSARNTINKSLKQNFYYVGREWVYKKIKPRILAEQYVEDEHEHGLSDYKFFCFNGVADCVMLCVGRESGHTKFYFFDEEWNLCRYNRSSQKIVDPINIAKPQNIKEMFKVAEKLSSQLKFARIDLYNANGKIYFGEITLCPNGGFDSNILPEIDLYFGDKINIDR